MTDLSQIAEQEWFEAKRIAAHLRDQPAPLS